MVKISWFKWILWALFTLFVLAVAWAGYQAFRGLPSLDGDLKVQGLQGPVKVTRDSSDVTHIQASSALDAWRALGFVHAQERGWQLEFNRRVMHGELSAVLGKATLDIDKLLRTLGIMRAARAQLAGLKPATQQALMAYSQGIQAAFASGHAGQSPEFAILGIKAADASARQWAAEDSVGWALMMALDLGGNWGNEFARFAMLETLNTEQLWQVWPPYPGESAPTPVDLAQFYRELGAYAKDAQPTKTSQWPSAAPKLAADAAGLTQWVQTWARDVGTLDGKGSNNWVIAGSRTASGKPLLANDPHLALSAPAIWYVAHLQAKAHGDEPALDVIGTTLPGLPMVVLGRTRGVAWGFTNTGPDVQDLYLEAIDPARPGQYRTPDGWQAFDSREEIIRVKGQSDVKLTVRSTRHGPVISDAQDAYEGLLNKQRYVMALRWSALDADNATLDAGIASNRAQTVHELRQAYALHHSPMQNIVMADTQGTTGYMAAGRVPVRATNNALNGVAPAPGWLAQYDWQSALPIENNPARSHADIAQQGWHTTANQKIVGANYPHYLGSDWHTPERMNRITTLLEEKPKHDAASMQAVQQDVLSLGAKALLPHALRARPSHALAEPVMALLRGFDGQMRQESAGAAILNVWAEDLTQLLIKPKVGDRFMSLYGKRHFRAGLQHLLDKPQAFWCPQANCDALISQAMDAAIGRLVQWQGDTPGNWRWGELHPALSGHRPFAKVAVLSSLFNVSEPSAGDLFTVNVGQYWANEPELPFANRHAASYRGIYDLSREGADLFIYQTGQSGHMLSGRSRDMAKDWANQGYRPLRFDPTPARHTLNLQPAP